MSFCVIGLTRMRVTILGIVWSNELRERRQRDEVLTRMHTERHNFGSVVVYLIVWQISCRSDRAKGDRSKSWVRFDSFDRCCQPNTVTKLRPTSSRVDSIRLKLLLSLVWQQCIEVHSSAQQCAALRSRALALALALDLVVTDSQPMPSFIIHLKRHRISIRIFIF